MKNLLFFYIRILFIVHCSLFLAHCFSQGTAINTTGIAADNSAMLDISSTEQGVLIPRMSTAQRNAIPSPAIGLLIYNTTTDRFNYYKSTGWYELLCALSSANKGNISPGGGTAININGASADPSAMLDISSTTRGFLPPRTSQGSVISPAKGLIIFDNSVNKYKYYNGNEWKTICENFITASTGTGSLPSLGTAINATGAQADNSAMLDISSSTKGLLIPRMISAQRDQILPKQGLMVYENSTTNTIDFSDGTSWYNLITDPPDAPLSGINIPSKTQIVWNWKTVSGAAGYKYNSSNDYSSANDNGTATEYTQTGLECNTPYTLYVWAYNDCGNSSATTLVQSTSPCFGGCPGVTTVTDVDNNVYNTVYIGTQCWIKENLKATKYRDGSAIPYVADNDGWAALSTGAYCYYENDQVTYADYGALYNWFAVNNPANLCPAGWHVPDSVEWNIMLNYLGTAVSADKLREAGTLHWQRANCGDTDYCDNCPAGNCNCSCFTALPGGFRFGTQGRFLQITYAGTWWSSTEYLPINKISAWDYSVDRLYSGVGAAHGFKTFGFSVRCLRD